MHGLSAAGDKTTHPDTWVFNIEAISTLSIAGWYVFGIFLTLWKDAAPASNSSGRVSFDNDVLAALSGFYDWGSNWVIPFLLGIFYLGAGYLFQKHQSVHGFDDWRSYMRREFIVLMTPFLAFTLLTLATGSLVSLEPALGDVGLVSSMPVLSWESFVDAVLVHPVGPVGYFMVLLGFFVIALFSKTPRTSTGMLALIGCAMVAKAGAIILADVDISDDLPYYLTQMMGNWIWFVLGMTVCKFKLETFLSEPAFAMTATAAFIGLIVVLKIFDITEAAALFALTLAGLGCAYSVSAARFLKGRQDAFFKFVTRYTMAIWLMHQMLAQATFCALFAIGFSPDGALALMGPAPWTLVCGIFCLIACYIFPIAIMSALSHIWKLGFIVYPARYLPAHI